ncbi:hypothetical protein QNA16_12920 [Gordonia alkanivorans]|nr:hypothetical protein [Gordonia alkanivorans]MDJ0008525.1 hypothetical protein [Gordonia alkanivorans]MDJ0098543.1 hypothetical protein [Gordonia alkanivorans]MDJ0494100.1 hypothetical protein [Gordonia alkanivorans]
MRAYCEWLHRVSGIDELRLAIGRRFLAVGDILKARTALAELREAAYRATRRDAFLEAIEEAETAPELHRLREVAALEALARWQPDSDLIGELTLVVASRDVRLLLSLPPNAAPPQIADAAKERATDCRTRRAFAATSAEKEALLVLEQTYQLVRRGRWTT